MSFALLLLLLLNGQALALPVLEVPPGTRTATVLLCDRGDGCPEEAWALGAHSRAHGAALLDFDALALQGPGGHDASARWAEALAGRRASLEAALAARDALRELPFTVPPEDLFQLWLALAGAQEQAGLGPDADRSLAAAASCSGGRVHDLPALPEPLLARYFDAAEQVALAAQRPGFVQVGASGGGQVFVDGRLMGPVPAELTLVPGWHRITVEATGARAAWAGELELRSERRVRLEADTSPTQGTGALEVALLGATRGQLPDASSLEPLLRWARARELRWVRFAALYPAAGFPPGVVELIPDPDPDHPGWAVRDVWLDVGAGRLVARDRVPASAATATRPMRFRVGLQAGYAQLDRRPGLLLELETLLRFRRLLSLELRVGLLRSAEPIYLYPGWSEHSLLPVALGLRLGPDRAGPYASLQAVAVVPYALGGLARAGWELAPTHYWRVGLEAGGGLGDRGWLVLGGLRLARRY
jgi:hypothetical protein